VNYRRLAGWVVSITASCSTQDAEGGTIILGDFGAFPREGMLIRPPLRIPEQLPDPGLGATLGRGFASQLHDPLTPR
jgi:hypothetical protein